MKIQTAMWALLLTVTAPVTFAVGLDFTPITGAVDGATVVTALGVIAGVMMLPRAAKWGYRQVMSMLGR
ncbi:TPA: hypothetical protein AB5B86_002914 [Vibrio cholerae]